MRWTALVAGALLLALSAFAVRAAGDWVVTNGLAYHFEKGKDFNWATVGAGLEKSLKGDEVRAAGGFYLNSNRDWSSYAALVWLPWSKPALDGVLRLGAIAGGATGYRQTVTPAVAAVAAYEMRGYGVNLVGIPPLEGTGGVLWIQFKTRW